MAMNNEKASRLAAKTSVSVREMIQKNKQSHRSGKWIEWVMPKILWLCAFISVLVTIGIIYTLVAETFTFFKEVGVLDFLTGKRWNPWQDSFGILPLISGTVMITVIAMLVAIPVGLATAIYLSEYASDRMRRIIKPILEVLAGIPTIVYGFFALTFITPVLRNILPDLSFFNALSAGIVVGVMIIPMVASLSEDAMRAVPGSLREGALALGSTKLETSIKVVLPAAFSGVIASFVLGISRAIGETMIVAVAAGSTPKLTFDPTQSIQTMTGYIVQIFTGDATYGSTIYYSVYAVGMTLFLFTLVMNLIAQFIARRFREEY